MAILLIFVLAMTTWHVWNTESKLDSVWKNWRDRLELCLLRPKESVPDYLPAIDALFEPGAVNLGVVAAGGSKSGFRVGLKLLQSTMLFLPLV